jgi:hypothetical protein
MDRDVGLNPRRGGNCCPAPAVFDQAHRDQVRAETTAGILPQMVSRRARLLPTERETKVMSHGRSISVLPNDMVAGIMFPDLRVAPLSSLSAQRIIARGIDDVIVGGIFHDAMREPDVPQQGAHLQQTFLAKESASRSFHHKNALR